MSVIVRDEISAYLLHPPTPSTPPPPRSNLADQPTLLSGSGEGGVAYQPGPGETGTTTRPTGQADGPVTEWGQQLTSYLRRTITARSSSDQAGPRTWDAGHLNRHLVPAGDTVTISVYTRVLDPLDWRVTTPRLLVRLYSGLTVLAEEAGPRAVIRTRDGWVRVTATLILPPEAGDADRIGWWLQAQPSVGVTWDTTGVMIERAPVARPYFDGDTPTRTEGDWTWHASWVGAPGYSASDLVPTPAPPDPPQRLDVESGQLALDRRWVPYGQATLTVAGPVLTNPARSDPPRLVIEATRASRRSLTLADLTATGRPTLGAWSASYPDAILADLTADYSTPYPGGAADQARSFDLTLRSCVYHSDTDTTTLTAATDEALARDYRLVSTTPVELSGPPHNPDDANTIIGMALARIGAAWAGFYGPSGRPTLAGGPPAHTEDRMWQPGESLWDYIEGMMIPRSHRVWCDEHRQWAGMHTVSTIHQPSPGIRRIYPTRSVITRTREEDRWADAIVVRFQWTDRAGDRRERYLTAQDTTHPTRVRYHTANRPPSQPYTDSLLRAALNSQSWAGAEHDAPIDLDVTPGDTLDLGDHALTCLAVQWTWPDNIMKVKA